MSGVKDLLYYRGLRWEENVALARDKIERRGMVKAEG